MCPDFLPLVGRMLRRGVVGGQERCSRHCKSRFMGVDRSVTGSGGDVKVRNDSVVPTERRRGCSMAWRDREAQ